VKRFEDMVPGTDFVFPVAEFKITDTFRMRSRYNHLGLDVCTKAGEKVFSMIPGDVTGIYPSASPGGWTVEVTNADERTVLTYSHLEGPAEKLPVKKGQAVAMGQVIGVVADTERPHVHLQLRAWIDAEKAFGFPKEMSA
jgi:murein DD-endopeptidase MepM/ murein hydrolase activator NlpD